MRHSQQLETAFLITSSEKNRVYRSQERICNLEHPVILLWLAVGSGRSLRQFDSVLVPGHSYPLALLDSWTPTHRASILI